MADIQYYLTFLTFIQVAIAFDFGMLYLDRKSNLMMIQDSWLEFLRRFYPKTIKAASVQLQRCRETMSEAIKVQRDDLKRMKEVFGKRYQKEEISKFLPGLGFSSGCFGMFLLIWLPMCARSCHEYRMDLLAVAMQATLFAQVLYVIAYICSKQVRETILGIILIGPFVALYFIFFHFTGILWRIDSYDIIFYCSLCVPFIPIAAYVILLLPMIRSRRLAAQKIRVETALLKQMLDEHNRLRPA